MSICHQNTFYGYGIASAIYGLLADNGQCYSVSGRKENFSNPRTQAKLNLYFFLMSSGKYQLEQVELDVVIPSCISRKNNPDDCYADIMVYEDKDHTKPLLLIECVSNESTEEEILAAKCRAAIKGYLLSVPKASYAVGLDMREVEL